MGRTFRSGSYSRELSMQKTFFVFLTAVAIVLPLATAYNCTPLYGENKRVCNYVEKQNWPQSEKDSIIQDAIDSGGSLNGNFVSITTKKKKDVELNKIGDVGPLIVEEDKKFLIELSSISIFGYVIYSFGKRHLSLLSFQ